MSRMGGSMSALVIIKIPSRNKQCYTSRACGNMASIHRAEAMKEVDV